MLFAIFFGAAVAIFTQNTIHYKDCKKRNFKPKACEIAKIMDNAAK